MALIAVGLRRLPPGRARPIDVAGAILLTGATAALLLLLTWGGSEFPWRSPDAAALAGVTVVLLGLFIRREPRAAEPLIRLSLFRNPVFARAVAVGGMMVFAMLGS